MVKELELIKLAQKGDRTAFRELVEHHKRDIYYTALNMTGCHQDADDISQEVFIKMYNSLGSFRGTSKLSSWLYRITVNCYLDRTKLKSRSSQEFLEGCNLEEYENGNTDNPETYIESAQINTDVENALKNITRNERAVFVLRHYMDLPLKEIAEIRNVSTGTVKSLLFRAIRKLRKELSFYSKEILPEKSK
jgi:RNA polymerase sigma-70 factor (ECF subfamily)